ncbi:MAG: hypothetical protein IPJ55_17095 [Chloracidobacterium sp.]|nr:hypothetical protein [Chloracidobacterium sp.]
MKAQAFPGFEQGAEIVSSYELAKVGVLMAGVVELDEGVTLVVSKAPIQAVLVSLLNKANCPYKVGASVVEDSEFHFVITPLFEVEIPGQTLLQIQ